MGPSRRGSVQSRRAGPSAHSTEPHSSSSSSNRRSTSRRAPRDSSKAPPARRFAMEHIPLTVEEGNLALVAVIFLVCTVEVMLIKAVTELSPSSVQALPVQLFQDDPSVAYLTGQYERPYLDDDEFDLYGEMY
ncbi:hypothetical protein FOCC_FOCC017668 [Frankliniella occidentalis]|nr:hypothetical protein FOCC_FOCC017668 [Frankliniella occidentalis]